MKRIVLLIIIVIFVLNQSCSHFRGLTNRYFDCGDSNKIYSLSFVNDTVCIYKQKFLFDMPEPYNEVKTLCKYETKGNKIFLKNLSQNRDSLIFTCFRIPEEDLNNIVFFKQDTLKRILMGAPPTFSRIDLYGYIDNIIADTLMLKGHKIFYTKQNDCNKYNMTVSLKFKEN